MEEHEWTARSLICSFFDYKTEKYVIAHNRTVGLLYRAMQVGILVYLIGWVFVTKKAYQETDTSIESSVSTKVKGAVLIEHAASTASPSDPAGVSAGRAPPRRPPEEAPPAQPSEPRAARHNSGATEPQSGSRFRPEERLKVGARSATGDERAEPETGPRHPGPDDDAPLRAHGDTKLDGPQTDTHRLETDTGTLKLNSDPPLPGELVSELQPNTTQDQSAILRTSAGLHGDAIVWDAADYVIPPQGENVFFVVTNIITTPGQRQGICPENPDIPGARCHNDSNCPSGEPVAAGNGVRTGRCVAFDATRRSCEVQAWCPVETGTIPRHPILAAAENFTVFIKNSIRFPKFSFRKHNVLEEGGGGDGLQRCRYDAIRHPYCPIFRLGELVRSAGARFDVIAVRGGVIGVRIGWQCDLDRPPGQCVPTYSFTQLDSEGTGVAAGYNFRFGKYYQLNGVEHRTLMKVYGIRFDVMVHGKAGKFNIVPTLINVGSGLALLGAGVFLCDLILLYISKKSPFYRERKYEEGNVTWKSSIRCGGISCNDMQEPYDEGAPTDVHTDYTFLGNITHRSSISSITCN